MESLWRRQAQLGDEPIYCAAYDESEPVLCAGSDEELDKTARVAKRLRYEEHGLRYLRGQHPRLVSASLRGPFNNSSGWQNPWASKQTKMKFAVTKPLAKSAAKPPQKLQKRLETIVAPEAGTPATRDSMQCHLPSPDSHRELDLNDRAHINAEKRTRIQEWANSVPADTLHRDEFWAPNDVAADMSDSSCPPKRPAGNEWLRSKLHKRRRTDPSSSGPLFTPTPALARAPAQTPRVSKIVKDPHSSRSFEQTTPSSSNAHHNDDSPPRPNDNPTGSGIQDSQPPLEQTSVAIKAAFLRRPSSDTLSTLSSVSSGQCMRVLRAGPQSSRPLTQEPKQDISIKAAAQPMAPTAEVSGDRDSQMEERDASFKSHLDHSFHYRTRSTKQAAAKHEVPTDGNHGNISQLTQTGTPESEDHDKAVAVQTHQPQQGMQLAPPELDQEGCHAAEVPEDQDEEPTVDPVGPREAVLAQARNTIGEQAGSEAELDDLSRLSESESDSGSGYVVPEHVPAHVCAPEATDTQVRIEYGSALLDDGPTLLEPSGNNSVVGEKGVTVEVSSVQLQNPQCPGITDVEIATSGGDSSADCTLQIAAPDEDHTLIGDLTDIDGSTLIRIPEFSQRLESIKYRDQPQALESVKYSPQTTAKRQPTRPSPSPQTSLAEIAAASLAQSTCAASNDAPSMKDGEDTPGNDTAVDHNSDAGNSVVVIPLSQIEWGVVGPAKNSPQHSSERMGEAQGECFIKIEPVGEDEASQPATNQAQSPWVLGELPLPNPIKTEPTDREWTPRSQVISVTDSPAIFVQRSPDLRPSQQSPWAPVADPVEVSSKGVSAELSTLRGPEHSQTPEGHQTPFRARAELAGPAAEDVLHNSSRPVSFASVEGSHTDVAEHCPFTPLEVREATPEVDLSIKSFAKFNTPSPRRKNGTPTYPSLSGGRFSSTQRLADMTGANPWSSARSSFRSSIRPRSSLRVSFAPLPGDDDEAVAAEHLAAPARAASPPPPQSSADVGDEDANAFFRNHFDAMRRRRSGATPKFRLQPHLLPSESQQKPISPEVGAMAEAFRDADVRMSLRSTPDMAGDETEIHEDDGENDGDNVGRRDDSHAGQDDSMPQSPWRAESQGPGVDDVAAVLQNLDDFLNPRWDVDAEVEKARSGDGIENQGPNRSSGSALLGSSGVWDMP